MFFSKGAIQHFVNAFFDSVMFLNTQSQIPQVIKYGNQRIAAYIYDERILVLDFLDHESYKNNVKIYILEMGTINIRILSLLIHVNCTHGKLML